VESDPTCMCALLVGLRAVRVLAVDDVAGGPIVVYAELGDGRPSCPAWADAGEGPACGRAGGSTVLRPPRPRCGASPPGRL